MELKEFMENKQIKDFTKRCLLNDNFAECRDTCLKVVEQTNNIDEFITDFLDRKNLMKYQGYWELAKELGTNKLRKMAIDYLEENRKNKEINIRYVMLLKGEYKGNGILLLNEIQSEVESNSACTPRNTNKNFEYY